jgi:hypothetical protein
MIVNQAPQLSSEIASTGLKAAVKIMMQWNAPDSTSMAALRISRATFYKAKKGALDVIKADPDQMKRISFILNIHQALRIVFENPDNVYGFMAMKNDNYYFNGKAPLELMASGDIIAIYEVFRRVDALRGGQW